MNRSSPLSKRARSIPSSVEKSAIPALLISRDTPSFQDGVISAMYQISLAVGSTSRSLEVILDKIDSIALKVEALEKQVHFLGLSLARQETSSLLNSEIPSDQEIQDWFNSLNPIPALGTSPDITCSETLFQSLNL